MQAGQKDRKPRFGRNKGDQNVNRSKPKRSHGDDDIGSFGYDLYEKKSRAEEPVGGKKRTGRGKLDPGRKPPEVDRIVSKEFRERASASEVKGFHKEDGTLMSDAEDEEIGTVDISEEDEEYSEGEGDDFGDGFSDSLDRDSRYNESIFQDVQFKITNLPAPYSKNTKDMLTDFITREGIDAEISGNLNQTICYCTLGNKADMTAMSALNGKLLHGKRLKIKLTRSKPEGAKPRTLWFHDIDPDCVTEESLSDRFRPKSITIDTGKRKAYLTFYDIETPRRLLEQREVTIGGCNMTVTLPKPKREVNPSRLVCWYCGKIGHARLDCPVGGDQNKTCWKCQTQGHVSKDCKLVIDLDYR